MDYIGSFDYSEYDKYSQEIKEYADVMLSKSNKLILEDLKDGLNALMDFMKTCKIPQTIGIMFLGMNDSNGIKMSIFDIAKNGQDIYSCAVLYRTILEIFVKIYYVLINYIEKKDDSFAMEFNMISEAKEMLAEANVAKKQGKDSSDDIFDTIKKTIPLFANSTKKEICNRTKNLTFSNMLDYVRKRDFSKEREDTILKGLVSDYSILSSFTHSGDYTKQYSFFTTMSSGYRLEEMKKTIKMSCNFTEMIKLQLFLLSSTFDESFLKYVEIVNNYIVSIL